MAQVARDSVQQHRTRPSGLSSAEAEVRLQREGYNELPRERRWSIIALAFSVLREPMLLLLVAATSPSIPRAAGSSWPGQRGRACCPTAAPPTSPGKQYERNVARLAANQARASTLGAMRNGAALLAG
jgi:hypothetical protein